MKENKFTIRINGIVLFIAAAIIVVATVFITYKFAGKMYYSNTKVESADSVIFDGEDTDLEKINKFNELIEYIEENYFYGCDENDLIEGAIKGMIEALGDGSSEYILPDEVDEFLRNLQGKDENGEYIDSVETEDLGEQIKYIKISRFTENTNEEFKDELTALLSTGTKGLIVDLRDNPGGNEDSAAKICDILAPEGTIATVKNKKGVTEKNIVSGENSIDVKIVVLVNENTCAAAEMVAGALKELGKYILVGQHTAGNGTTQKLTENDDGSCIYLTVWEYFTTEGNKIEGIGIAPDYTVENTGEDLQIAKALELLKE